jgi:hypothetical protein
MGCSSFRLSSAIVAWQQELLLIAAGDCAPRHFLALAVCRGEGPLPCAAPAVAGCGATALGGDGRSGVIRVIDFSTALAISPLSANVADSAWSGIVRHTGAMVAQHVTVFDGVFEITGALYGTQIGARRLVGAAYFQCGGFAIWLKWRVMAAFGQPSAARCF